VFNKYKVTLTEGRFPARIKPTLTTTSDLSNQLMIDRQRSHTFGENVLHPRCRSRFNPLVGGEIELRENVTGKEWLRNSPARANLWARGNTGKKRIDIPMRKDLNHLRL